jgi:hypothetical protein
MFNIASVFVGFEAAVSLCDFVKKHRQVVTVNDILVDGKIELTDDFGINDHTAIVEKMEASGIFNELLPPDSLDNLSTYFKVLPSEVAMKLWYSLASSGGDIQNTINLHPKIKKELVAMLTDIETQEVEAVDVEEANPEDL